MQWPGGLLCLACASAAPLLGLEEIAERYGTPNYGVARGTDKGRHRHGYTDVYAMLFDDRREKVFNVTEIGTAQGFSIPVWLRYFSNAHVWTYDIRTERDARQWLTSWLPQAERARVHYSETDATSAHKVAALGLEEGSMDLIIDDGAHSTKSNRRVLHLWWKYLRPGGYFVTEDVSTGSSNGGMVDHKKVKSGQGGHSPYAHELDAYTAQIYQENDVFFANTAVGHQNFTDYLAHTNSFWATDKVNHNSNMLVIRKRATPRPASSYPGYREIDGSKPAEY